MRNKFATSESVAAGHPDKLADKIADTILDFYLDNDVESKVACEVALKDHFVLLFGEISSFAPIDKDKINEIVKQVFRDVGYSKIYSGIDPEALTIFSLINEQSKDISVGLKNGGAGDQGIVYGYACDETEELMPLPIFLAHEILKKCNLDGIKHGPDGKCQVTVEYGEKGKPIKIKDIVLSIQQRAFSYCVVEEYRNICKGLFNNYKIRWDGNFFFNNTGIFLIGGPLADSGLTGRKTQIDTYGGVAKHGGGAFSGKDYTKIDRSGAYAARWISKSIVAAGFAKKCEVSLAYAIGHPEPVMIDIETFGTNEMSEETIIDTIKVNFDLSLNGIVETLDLKNQEYAPLATFGHFGKEEYPWEQVVTLV